MSAVKNGDTVKVHYRGTLKNGEEFDSSAGREPLEFQVGQGHVIPGFENGMLEMTVGEKKTIEIPVKDGYGERDEKLVWNVDKNRLPADLDPQKGQMLQSIQEDGRRISVKVTDVTDTNVTLDANHPLAGEDLIFEVELMEIV